MKIRVLFLVLALPLLIIFGCTSVQQAADVPDDITQGMGMTDAEAIQWFDDFVNADQEGRQALWDELTPEQQEYLRDKYGDDIATFLVVSEEEDVARHPTYEPVPESETGAPVPEPAEELETESTPLVPELGQATQEMVTLPPTPGQAEDETVTAPPVFGQVEDVPPPPPPPENEIPLVLDSQTPPLASGLSPSELSSELQPPLFGTGAILVSPSDDTCERHKAGDDFVVMECQSSLYVYDFNKNERIDVAGSSSWKGAVRDIAVGDGCLAVVKGPRYGESDPNYYLYRFTSNRWAHPDLVGGGDGPPTQSVAVSDNCDVIALTHTQVLVWPDPDADTMDDPLPIWEGFTKKWSDAIYYGVGRITVAEGDVGEPIYTYLDSALAVAQEPLKRILFSRCSALDNLSITPYCRSNPVAEKIQRFVGDTCFFERRFDQVNPLPIAIPGIAHPLCPMDVAIARGWGMLAFVDSWGKIKLYYRGRVQEERIEGKHVAAANRYRIAYENAGSVYVYDRRGDGMTYTVATGVWVDAWPSAGDAWPSISPNGNYVSFKSGGKIYVVPYARWNKVEEGN